MKIGVMADGVWDFDWGSQELQARRLDLLICADGGANLAISSGKTPDVLIGDLDSITPENLQYCRAHRTVIKRYPAQKDQTDLELAVEYAETYLRDRGTGQSEIFLYAAGGKRLDHLLGNIAVMLSAAQKKQKIKMVDKDYQAWVMYPGEETVRGRQGQILSLIPLSAEVRVKSEGLVYELEDSILLPTEARGVSNIFRQDEVRLEVVSGYMLVFVLN